MGEGNGAWELEQAWHDVYGQALREDQRRFYLRQPQGEMMYIGLNKHGQPVYWTALGNSKSICKQAWADLWPLIGDCIVYWEFVERSK